MREHRAAHAAATQDAAADQKPQEPALFVFAALVLLRTVLALIFVLVSFAEKMRDYCAAHAGATQHAAGDQKPQNPAVFVVAALVLVLIFLLVLVLVLAFFAQEMREQCATHAGAT
jgi:ABC-type Fe3+ transport system permease subunit